MRTRSLLLTVVVVALSSAACMTSATIDANNIEVTWRGLRFDGAPVGEPDNPMSTEASFELNAANLSWAKNLEAKASVKQVRLVPAEGIQDLGFLELVTATMAAKSSPENAMAIASYQRPTAAASYPQLTITNPQPIEVTETWASKKMRVAVMILGQLPTEPWSVDVTIVLDGEFTARP